MIKKNKITVKKAVVKKKTPPPKPYNTKLETINVAYETGNSKKPIAIDKVMGLTEEGKNEFLKEIISPTCVETEGKFYFFKGTGVPTERFKKEYPKATVTRNMNKADVIVIHKLEDLSPYGYAFSYDTEFLECPNGCWSEDEEYPHIVPGGKKMKFYEVCEEELDEFYETMKPYLDRKIMLLEDIKFTGKTMNDEAFLKVNSMLEGSDVEMQKLGMRLLCSYNYMAQLDRITLMYAINDNLRNGRIKEKSKEMYFVGKMVRERYTLGRETSNSSKISLLEYFWPDFLSNNRKDPLVKKEFEKWMGSVIFDGDASMEINIKYRK